MKKLILFGILALMAGCSYGSEQVTTWIQDPHYMQYTQKRDTLESSYLKGELDYADYLEQKQALDDTYAKEDREREEKIIQQKQLGE